MVLDLQIRLSILNRAQELTGRIIDHVRSREDFSLSNEVLGDINELAEILEKIGYGPLGKRLATEAKMAQEASPGTRGLGTFFTMALSQPRPGWRIAGLGYMPMWLDRIKEVLDALKSHGEAVGFQSSLDFSLLAHNLAATSKIQAATLRSLPLRQELAVGIRQRAIGVLSRIEQNCSEAISPKLFGIRVIVGMCRPDLVEAIGCLNQLGYVSQGRRLQTEFDSIILEGNNGFFQDGAHEIAMLKAKAPPPPKDDPEEVAREARLWMFKRVVSEFCNVAKELRDFLRTDLTVEMQPVTPRGLLVAPASDTSALERSEITSTPKRAKTDRESQESLARRAEIYVKEDWEGNFQGVRKLARALGCEKRPSSLSKAIKSSKYLSARKAEHKQQRGHALREHQLSEVHVDRIAQSRESDPDEALDQLMKEQKDDMRRDNRSARRRSFDRSQ